MKHLLLSCLFVLSFSLLSIGQNNVIENGKLNGTIPVDETGNAAYVVVKDAPNLTRDELYKRGRKWYSKMYDNSKNTIKVSDSNTGEITGKGVFYAMGKILINQKYAIYHSLSLEIKDNRYRIKLTDFEADNTADIYGKTQIDKILFGNKKLYATLYQNINTEALSLIASLEKALSTSDDF